ncbi:MAG: response regulator transcription factor [Acidobacteria bacterium]|nr:response regulator transcription factor [Acidobacteriota bacterium]
MSRDPSGSSWPVVHVVDDDAGVRKGLCRLLEAAGYTARPHASAGDFLLEAPFEAPACVLLDVRMPGPSGLELQEALVGRGEDLPIVFLSGHGDIPMAVRALKLGAVDFLTKPVKREKLLAAVAAALAHGAERRQEREELRTLRERYETLTPREREVLALVVSGRLNKQIAGEIGAAERTVKAHRANAMEKLGADSLADLVRIASRLGVPKPPSEEAP